MIALSSVEIIANYSEKSTPILSENIPLQELLKKILGAGPLSREIQ